MSSEFLIIEYPNNALSIGMKKDELYWKEDYNLISKMAEAIRQDLSKIEMPRGFFELHGISASDM